MDNVDHTGVNNKLERFLPEKTPHQELVDCEEATNNIYRTNKTRDTNVEINCNNKYRTNRTDNRRNNDNTYRCYTTNIYELCNNGNRSNSNDDTNTNANVYKTSNACRHIPFARLWDTQSAIMAKFTTKYKNWHEHQDELQEEHYKDRIMDLKFEVRNLRTQLGQPPPPPPPPPPTTITSSTATKQNTMTDTRL